MRQNVQTIARFENCYPNKTECQNYYEVVCNVTKFQPDFGTVSERFLSAEQLNLVKLISHITSDLVYLRLSTPGGTTWTLLRVSQQVLLRRF